MANDNALAVLNKTKQGVFEKIDSYIQSNQLALPPNYSFGTALNQFQLAVQDDSKIMSCTQASIAKTMLDMAIMGLSLAKNQCYVIPYGNQAKLHVSYLGKVAIAKRIDPTIDDIVARTVKAGEIFEFEDNFDGYSMITKHQRTLESMDSKDIIAAYATILYNDGKPPKSMIMTFERIKKSWSMSQMRPVQADGSIKTSGVHGTFTDEMCCKTVISAICKPIIAHSDDGSLFSNTVQTVEIEEVAAQSKAEVEEQNGNGDYIDFVEADYTPVEEVVDNNVEDVENVVEETEEDFKLF